MKDNTFTPTQQRMIDVLRDGLPHRPEELRLCIGDELASVQNIWAHLTNIRNKIRPQGEDILCEWVRCRRFYRHIVLLRGQNGSNKGPRPPLESP